MPLRVRLRSGKGIEEVVKEMGLPWKMADSRELEEAIELARRRRG
jgi:hypothetical protein